MPYDFTYMWNLKKQNKQKKQKQTHKQKEETGICQRPEGGGWAKWVKSSGGYRLPVMEYISYGIKGAAQGIWSMVL